ncbi:MAG: bifunctional 5,10-methylenetetrahydrofolate dehydrogenase/5,10-methenyltetrahydrofolate cyclohydrolase [Candidatus Xenobia bacterium]
MARTLDGKSVEADLLRQITQQVSAMERQPTVAILLVGDDPSSRKYAQLKVDRSRKAGMEAELTVLPASTTQDEVLAHLGSLGRDDRIHAIFVEFPLPPHLDAMTVANAIPPHKDVEGVSLSNAGRLTMGRPGFVPTTAAACIKLLDAYELPIAGQHAVVVGRSHVVGRPLAMLLLARDATVTVCHSATRDLASYTRQADILVAAAGRAALITADKVKPGAGVIDVGMNYTPQGLKGDIDFAPVAERASWITPVPGGVGPVTTGLILQNVAEAALRGSPAPAAPR